ncbi:Flp family type IVb pilin [Actinomadura hibisca]|uniref:Flp family type IVb pilin n=1 Tax=Actinomadura hibisca TaxID=68565 RepID=UPI00082F69B2|nr:hypothetical protein [Actinomadura hibisca]
MLRLITKLQTLLADSQERGATAVEFGLMMLLITVISVGTVLLLARGLGARFGDLLGRLG